MPLSSKETQRRKALVSKLKEETMSREEALELIYLLEKEKSVVLEEQGGDSMLVFAILSLIAYVNEYLDSHSELSKKE